MFDDFRAALGLQRSYGLPLPLLNICTLLLLHVNTSMSKFAFAYDLIAGRPTDLADAEVLMQYSV